MSKIGVTARNTLASPAYERWRGEVVLDFGDYTFTRNELDDMGVGLHTKAASILQRLSRKHKLTLADFRRIKADGAYDLSDVGNTCLIVLASCLLVAFPAFDFDVWIASPSRTFVGGVRKITATPKRT